MTITTVAYYQSVLSSGTFQRITPVPDQTVRIAGSQLFVPDKVNQLCVMAGALSGATTGTVDMQYQSPSLREIQNPYLFGYRDLSDATSVPPLSDLRSAPIGLVTNEPLEFWSDAGGDGTTALGVYGLAWFSDGKVTPSSAPYRTVQVVIDQSMTVGQWGATPGVWTNELPVGTYDVVGLHGVLVGGVAVRLVPVGAMNGYRSAAIPLASYTTTAHPIFEPGQLGVLTTFDSTTPPTFEVLASATPVVGKLYIDVVKR